MSRGQQVRGVQEEFPEEGRADLRLDGWKQSLQLQRQAGQAAADEVELLSGRLEWRREGAEMFRIIQGCVSVYSLIYLCPFSSSGSSNSSMDGANSQNWVDSIIFTHVEAGEL